MRLPRRRLIRTLAVGTAVGFLGLVPAVAAAKPPGTYARLFPKLDAFTAGTDQQLADLAGGMCEEQPAGLPPFGTACHAQPGTQTDNGTHFVLGQFLDHDLSLDREPQPNRPVNLKTLDNTRTALLDLDSVYGDGPKGSPELYEADGRRLRVGVSNDIPDVPRRADGSAILADGRNDETLIIAQLHAAFLRFHNALVDQPGVSFAEARRTARHQWQWLVLNEYLPRFAPGAGRIAGYKPANKHDPVLPVEFAVAAFRFGHSQVGGPYQLNGDPSSRRHVFSFDPAVPTLVGGRPIPAGAGIDWRRFFDVGPETPPGQFNPGRRIDTRIHLTLFQLPIPGAAATGSNLLVHRTLVRSKHYGLPSYEDVARALGIAPVDVSKLHPEIPAVFAGEAPLFYGILAESEALGGARLGPTGARIVNEVIRTNVERDPDSYLNRRPAFEPLVRSVGGLLRFAGVV
jgi:Animal haem peroxidase